MPRNTFECEMGFDAEFKDEYLDHCDEDGVFASEVDDEFPNMQYLGVGGQS